MKQREELIRYAVLIAGSIIAAYGIDLAIYAGFGYATLAVLWQGISIHTGLSLGQSSGLVALIMIFISLFLDRRQIFWGTIIYQVFYSLFTDIFASCLFYTQSAVLNFFIMLLGLAIFSVGTALYSFTDRGRGPYEALMFAIVKRSGWQIKYVRISLDILFVLLGLLMGGSAGLCTLGTIALSGLLIQTVRERLQKRFPQW